MKDSSFLYKNLIALFLVLASALGVLAVGIGTFAKDDGDKSMDAIENILDKFTSGTTTPERDEVTEKPLTPPVGPDISPDERYENNLSHVFVSSRVDGLITDRRLYTGQERAAAYERLCPDYLSDSAEDGYTLLKAEVYERQNCVLTAEKWTGDNHFTCGTEIVEVVKNVPNVENGGFTSVVTPTVRERIAVDPYMGYVLYTHKDGEGNITTSLCMPDGTVIFADLGEMVPAYARDFTNAPLFKNADGSKFYALRCKEESDVSTYSLEAVVQEKVRVGLSYDYPATPVGLYQDKFELSYRTDRGFYLYYNYKNMQRCMSTHILFGFNFGKEGLAVVQKSDERQAYIINSSGKNVFKGQTSPWVDIGGANGKLYVIYRYQLPKTFGIESMGCQGFDNGWVRLLVQTVTAVHGTLVAEEYRLMNTEGKFFNIPTGYTLEGYSDGVLLLEKDGLYGYYSIDEKWIAQPIYTYARPFIQGLAVVGYTGGTVGMIDTEGNIVLPFVFTSLSDVSSGRIVGFCENVGFTVFSVMKKTQEDGKENK